MKTMLRKGLYLLGSWLFFISLTAQNLPVLALTPEELANNQTETMTAELSLSQEQIQKVKEINLNYSKKIHGSDADKPGHVEAFDAKVTELKSVLTGEQYEKWQAKRAYWSKLIKESLIIAQTPIKETEL